MISLNPYNIPGFPDAQKMSELLSVYNYHEGRNKTKSRYYEGHIRLNEVNLGIAIPKSYSNLEVGCEWGAKCVDVLASRSMFDGFVSASGDDASEMNRIMDLNRMRIEYHKATCDELKYGCSFATLSADRKIGCKIRFHSPETAAALWNGEKGRIDCGFAIIDTAYDESDQTWTPALINYYNDTDVYILRRAGTKWSAERYPQKMGRPLMEPLIWNATSSKPFGRSRIKEPIRRLIQGYVRTMAEATLALEFATAPQKYLLGVSDDQYDNIVNNKFKQYIGGIIAATNNPDTGEKPTFGQLQQGNISPHVEMMRMLATQFSAATGLSVTDTGVVNDANPTSSDAIIAQTQTLITLAERLNSGNADALNVIAQMAQAITRNVSLSELTEQERSVVAHFKNPAMPSVASTSDAAVKIASSRTGFANTDVYLEMVGFDQADIRRIKAQERKERGAQVLAQEFNNGNVGE